MPLISPQYRFTLPDVPPTATAATPNAMAGLGYDAATRRYVEQIGALQAAASKPAGLLSRLRGAGRVGERMVNGPGVNLTPVQQMQRAAKGRLWRNRAGLLLGGAALTAGAAGLTGGLLGTAYGNVMDPPATSDQPRTRDEQRSFLAGTEGGRITDRLGLTNLSTPTNPPRTGTEVIPRPPSASRALGDPPVPGIPPVAGTRALPNQLTRAAGDPELVGAPGQTGTRALPRHGVRSASLDLLLSQITAGTERAGRIGDSMREASSNLARFQPPGGTEGTRISPQYGARTAGESSAADVEEYWRERNGSSFLPPGVERGVRISPQYGVRTTAQDPARPYGWAGAVPY